MNNRSAYLDGLRGFAAVQVIFLHYFTALIPVLAFPGPYQGFRGFIEIMGGTPAYYFFDGNSAIYIFFLLSGYVLTRSYVQKAASWWELALTRTLRLGIPVSASLIIAWILLSIFPDQHVKAGQIVQSHWLSDLCNVRAASVSGHLREIFGGSILLGYGDSSFWFFFPRLYDFLKPSSTGESLNFPLWTLNIEFYGSLLIILLCAIWKKSRPLYWVALIILIGFFQPFSISLFFIGHLFALAEKKFPQKKAYPNLVEAGGTLAGWILIAFAIWISSRQIAWPWLDRTFHAVPIRLLEKSVGMILIFGVVLFFKRAGQWGRPLIALFESDFFQFLGKRSFSVYLLHVPILFTFSSYLFVYVSRFQSRAVALDLAIFWGVFFTYLVAGLFEKYVDQNAIKISKRCALFLNHYAFAISKARSAKP